MGDQIDPLMFWLFEKCFHSGHFWRLLPSGKQVVEVKGEGFSPVTKLITVVPGEAELDGGE